jgi:tRNA nucleotidyltransferase (CCA-adding enzyme)
VSVVAGDLVDGRVVSVPAASTNGEALAAARKRDAAAVVLGDRGDRLVLRGDLARAVALGLEAAPASVLVWPVPSVHVDAPEVRVRRLRAGGAPVIGVTDGRRMTGIVARLGAPPVVDLAARFAGALPEVARAALVAAGEAAVAHRSRAFAVGGLVRDVLRGGLLDEVDLDVAVEGDGLAVAMRVAERLGGEVRTHPRFLTASVTGVAAGRIDIATCRSERYETPAALPKVMPATIEEDLRRRDFSVNALAVELGVGAFGLLDPEGGRRDLGRRRLQVLHPLSFVEDPTRIFRAARYAERLGFAVAAASRRAQALALRLAPYPALSGERLSAELAHVVADARPAATLTRLGRAGAFRLLDSRYRFTAETARHLARLPEALAWARAQTLGSPLDLTVLAIVASQPAAVAGACLTRLAFRGEPLARLVRALGEADDVTARLRDGASPASRAHAVAGRGAVELAWLWLLGDAAVRGRLDEILERTRDARPTLRGDDVIALGVAAGPQVARVLAGLRDARMNGAVSDPAGERAWVRAWARAHG